MALTGTLSVADLTAFQRDTLVVVAKGDGMKGLEVKEELARVRDEEVHHGRMYPNLDELADRGLIEKGERDRRTNNYAITQEGRAVIGSYIEWLVAADDGGDADE